MDNNEELLIELMNVYLEEWKHRDSIMWEQVFRFYMATLVVSVLPYTNIINSDGLFSGVFLHCVGIFLSFVFLYVSFAYGIRLIASADTYEKIVSKLSSVKLQRTKLNDLKYPRFVKRIVGKHIVVVLPTAMFISLLVVNIVFWLVE